MCTNVPSAKDIGNLDQSFVRLGRRFEDVGGFQGGQPWEGGRLRVKSRANN